MAAIHQEIEIKRSKEFIWDAIRDVGNIHKRLVPGFVTDCKLDGDWRTVTFGNGKVARELILSVDDERLRHSWAAVGEPFAHYNASVQVFPESENRCRVVWITDLMPNEIADSIEEMIHQGLKAMKHTLEMGGPSDAR